MHRFVVKSMGKTVFVYTKKISLTQFQMKRYQISFDTALTLINLTFGACVPGRIQWAAFDNVL